MNEHIEIRNLLTLAAAGALNAAEQRRVEEHLHQCASCRTEFSGWSRLAGVLRELPTEQAPRGLVEQTRRRLEMQATARMELRRQRLILGSLIAFAWTITALNWPLYQLLDDRLTQWLDLSSSQLTVVWTAYILVMWLATALTAALLGRRSRQEGRTI